MVLNWNGAISLTVRRNLAVALLFTLNTGSAYPQREQTSMRAYALSLSDDIPSWAASISTRYPGFSGIGLGGYVCHFFHLEYLDMPHLLNTRFTVLMLTTIFFSVA